MSEYSVSEISARSPDMDARAFAEFVEDIRANGQLVPIWIRGDEVIDGRKRLAACQQLGIEPNVVNLDPEQDAEHVARALNVLRTHYAPTQRAAFAQERATATKADAGRMRHGSNCKFTVAESVVTIKQVAAEAGVSPSAVSKARKIAQSAAPEVIGAMKAGKLTTHAASQIADRLPRDEQAAAVVKTIEANKGKARHTSTAQIITGVDVRLNRAAPKKPVEQFTRSIQMADEAARVMLANAPLMGAAPLRSEWIQTLCDVRTTISRTIKNLEALT